MTLQPTKTLIATDVRLYAEGLAIALEPKNEISVVGIVFDVDAALDWLRERPPHILLLDPSMPGARMLTRSVFASPAQTKVVMLGLAEVESEVVGWATEGIAGFVTRENSLDQLAATLVRVSRDEWRSSPRIMSALLRHLAALAQGRQFGETDAHLTEREYEVAHLLTHGLSNKQIAHELGIAASTAKNHVHNILAKLQLGSRGEAAAWVRARGLPRRPRAADARSALFWEPQDEGSGA